MECWRKRLEEELRCCICLEYLKDPVTLDCGHNYCLDCINTYWGDSPTYTACPQCREMIQVKRLKPNTQLANVINITKQMIPLQEISVVIEKAAQECKDPIRVSLDFLRKERENMVLYKSGNETESQDLLKQMQEEREKTRTAFRQHHQFLEDQEKLRLAQMDEVEMEIMKRRVAHQAILSGEIASLDSLIRELEEQQQSANENFGNVLDRCPNKPFQNPETFPVAVKWKVQDFSDINHLLEGLMKQFQVSLISGLTLQKAHVTLDSNTAHAKIILSEDCKNMRYGPRNQDLPNNPERFDMWPFVLGKERMTSGRHFWEVTLGREEYWSLGVAKNNVKRKGKFNVCPYEGIWQFGMWGGAYQVEESTSLPLTQTVKKIRVTLNCGGGRVAFFDADTGTQLHYYSDASLLGETLLPFFYVFNSGQMTLCP